MKEANTLVHLIHRDKFTTGYIDFMKKTYSKKMQYFFTLERDFELQPCDLVNVIVVKSYNKLFMSKYHKILETADIIIVSGVFRLHQMFPFLSKKIIGKTYLHFWGGDFYWAEKVETITERCKYLMLKFLITNCKGTVNLIKGDVEVLNKLFPNNTLHYIAPVPGDPDKPIDYSNYACYSKSHHKNIMIGNSGSKTNNHIEVLQLLKRYKDEDIDIFCPLSYTDSGEKYIDEVIEIGKKIFNQRFHEMRDFMGKKQYLEFLSTIDIAIFNNNRQQGMGNISILLRMGKKVFLKTTTGVWERYQGFGYTIYSVDEIQNIDYKTFIEYPYDIYMENLQKNTWKDELNRYVTCWNEIVNCDSETIHG